MYGNDPKRDNTHLFHFRRGVEQIEKPVGDQLEGCSSAEHHADGKQHGKLQGFVDSPFVSGTVIKSQDRNQPVVKTEYRHEEEALELEIYTEDSGCGGREGNQDQIHQVGHDGADAHHQDRRYADKVNSAYDLSVRMKNGSGAEMNLAV